MRFEGQTTTLTIVCNDQRLVDALSQSLLTPSVQAQLPNMLLLAYPNLKAAQATLSAASHPILIVQAQALNNDLEQFKLLPILGESLPLLILAGPQDIDPLAPYLDTAYSIHLPEISALPHLLFNLRAAVRYQAMVLAKKPNLAIERHADIQLAAMQSSASAMVITNANAEIEWANPAFERLTGYTFEEVRGQNPRILKSGLMPAEHYQQMWETITNGQVWQGEMTNRRKNGNLYYEEMTITPVRANGEGTPITHYVAVKQDVTERRQTVSILRQRNEQLTMLNRLMVAVNSETTPEGVLDTTLKELARQFSASFAVGGLLSDDQSRISMVVGWRNDGILLPTGVEFPISKTPLAAEAIAQRKPVMVNNFPNDARYSQHLYQYMGVHPQSALVLPLYTHTKVLGVLVLYWTDAHKLVPHEVQSLGMSTALAVSHAVENTRLLAETEQQVQYLEALHGIDQTIAKDHDFAYTTETILAQAQKALNVDATGLMLLDPQQKTLALAGAQGFQVTLNTDGVILLGEGAAGRAALHEQIVEIPDVREWNEFALRDDLVQEEDFIGYFALPLILNGAVLGVLEFFHRKPLYLTTTQRDFAMLLAGQTALAISRHNLVSTLQRTTSDLESAYTATLEGWVRALDLRDHETEGHSLRVTDMTVRLATMMGISGDALEHIRRGSLLHDIGKMAIPDSILNKPGPLTDEEWAIMKQHPQHAYDWLNCISYLQPALDIPYAHHERWDGTGYPRGLKGEEIPFAARIFAVVDVWDALTSDRPYRKAWTPAETAQYLADQAGKQFDPAIVEYFFTLMERRPVQLEPA